MKDLAILSFELIFFILSFLKKSQQSIYSFICLVLAIIDLKMVSKELLGQIGLLGAQTPCIYKTTEIIMVHHDKNLMFAAFQVVIASFKCFNNS